ncbi:MAG: helix-turn-helix domain-containing protein [Pseudomonadota bacterium]
MKKKPTKTKSKNTLGKEIIEGLKETLDFIKGKETGGRAYFIYAGQIICIQDIRERLGMTREEFAKNFLFKLNTVRNWEQGIRQPNGHTLAYLSLIASDPLDIHKRLKQTIHHSPIFP